MPSIHTLAIMKSYRENKLIYWFVGGWIVISIAILFFYWPIIYSELSYLLRDKSGDTQELAEDKSSEIKKPEKLDVPDKIVISKIEVDAPLVEAKSVGEQDILDALGYGVAHYPNTPLPGEVGNVFVTGHSSNYFWEGGKYNYVFSLLNKLRAGDDIVVYYDGVRYVYQVFEVVVVDSKDISVMNQTGDSILSIMTCDPPGTSWSRRIVKARQISPDPSTNKEIEFMPVIPDELIGN